MTGALPKSLTSKGEHWYGWCKHIARFDDTPPSLKHVKAHTSTATVAERMNDDTPAYSAEKKRRTNITSSSYARNIEAGSRAQQRDCRNM
jgi:hypothetical protein